MRGNFSGKLIFNLLALLLACAVVPAWGAAVAADDALGLLTGETEQVATTSRLPRPTSKIAENVTVITAEDIARINAHTLADVLQTVSGIQLDQVQTPGSSTFFSILSTINRHILVQIDGVPQNFLSSDNNTAIGSIPVQQIERIEIVKGAASAAWGSALGGVVNIITKSPDPERPVAGLVAASIGEHSTADSRGELSGTVDRFGYYLSGGNLYSRGLTPGTNVRFNHGFGKFTYDLPGQGSLTTGLDLREKANGLEDYIPYDFHDIGGDYHFSGYLNLVYPLADRLTMELRGQAGRREIWTKWGALTVSDLFLDGKTREDFRGGSLHFNWGDALANLTAGLEYEHHDLHGQELVFLDPANNFDLTLERVSASLNGAYTLGRLTLLPGLRLDHTNLFDNALSYTLGATYRLSDDTLLRSYAARGYSMPIVNNLAISNGSRELQNIWTVQAGIETTAIPYLWFKSTLFYNNIWKIQQWDASTTPATASLQEQVRQGFELEAKTSPLYGFALAGGYNYTEAWTKETGTPLTGDDGVPQQGAKLALHYDNDELGLSGALTGNYVWWRMTAGNNAKSSGTIWDLHLTKRLWPERELSPEIFFSGRNLFNGTQYQTDFKPNAPRWFEGGLRFKF